MDTASIIAKNTSFLLIAQVISLGTGFFYLMYTARYLGPESFGILSLTLSITGILSVVTDMGLGTLAIREIARERTKANIYVGNILLIKLILSIFALFLITFIVIFMGYPKQTIIILYLIELSVIFSAFSGPFTSIFQAFQKMEYQSISGILYSLLMLGGAIVIIHYDLGLYQYAMLYAVVSLVITGYNILICSWKFAIPKFEINYQFWAELFKEALPFAITGISINIYYWINTIILSQLSGNEVAGWYNVAYRLVLVFLFIPVVFNTSFYPIMSKYYITSKNSLKTTFEQLLKVTLYIGLPLGIGIIAIADKIIKLMYGDQYYNSIIIMQILSISLILIFCRSPLERLSGSE